MKQRLVRFDWAMKKLLRNKANFEILEGFLSELLKKDIKIREILESEGNKDSADDKYNRLDLLADSSNELIAIEVQISNQYEYFHRMLYGTSKLITDYMESGESYAKIRKVISIHVVYFDLGQGLDYVYHGKNSFIGLHQHDQLNLSERQRELFGKSEVADIFPEYYLLKVNNFNDIARDSLDEWMYFLKNSEIKSEFSAKGIKKASKELDLLKLSEQKRKEYEQFINIRRAEESLIWNSKIEGKIEGKIEIARNMLHKKMAIEDLMEITGLSREEIENV